MQHRQLCRGITFVGLSPLLLLLQLVAERAVSATISKEQPARKAFQVYWNVPSFMCRKYNIQFPDMERRFGILQNIDDQFRGDQIAILYDPGVFPAFLQAENDTILVRNGGVPQEGELALHLEHFREDLIKQVPDREFSGLGVIDMESWRPIFRQNWAALEPYRAYSIKRERERHPWWSDAAIKKEAKRRFEKWARIFMENTLRTATKLRPKARWGYYAYPYCFNWTPSQQSNQCAPQVAAENDETRWLFGTSAVLYPSAYLPLRLNAEQRRGMVRGRVQEAVRIAAQSAEVLVYFWFKYQDQRDTYVEKRDIVNAVTEMASKGADGMVIWGSSSDLDSRIECLSFANYVNNTLGPALARATQRNAP